MTSPPAASGPRRAALAFILVTVTLDMLAFGIVIPVLPRLILDFTGSAENAAFWQAGLRDRADRACAQRRALFFGVGMGLLAFALYGLAWHAALVFVAIACGGFWGVWNAASQSLLSQAVDAGEQGRLQGALASLRALCQVLTPGLCNGAFALGVAAAAAGAEAAGAPMLVSALLLALALPFAVAAVRGPAAARAG
jgi:hypothetical protein